jgi:hypothetical protein
VWLFCQANFTPGSYQGHLNVILNIFKVISWSFHGRLKVISWTFQGHFKLISKSVHVR